MNAQDITVAVFESQRGHVSIVPLESHTLVDAGRHGRFCGLVTRTNETSTTTCHTDQWSINAFGPHGMDGIREKHSDVIEKRVEGQFRKRSI
jgi:hypothetical protein